MMVLSVALAAPVAAKDVRVKPHAEAPLTEQESAALARALDLDDAAFGTNVPDRSLGTPSLSHPLGFAVNRSENADGSSTVTVQQTLSRDWDAKVGADINVAAAPATTYEPDKPWPGTANDKPSGAAFGSLRITRFATVDARVDPGSDQGTLGATVKHSVPLGGDVSATLQSRFAVTDTLSASATTADAAAAAPTISDDQAVQLNIGATGTTLSAGVSGSSTDPTTHHTLSAEQTIYGPLHVTTAITDPGTPDVNKSVTAGFNLTW